MAEPATESRLPGDFHRRHPRQAARRAGRQPAISLALAVAVDGERDILGLWRASFRYAARRHGDAIARALKPVCTAAAGAAALERFMEFAEAWGGRYPAIVKLWEDAWAEFVPFLSFDAEIRRVICSTNAIESVNARIRRAVNARGHFPNEQAALTCVYMAIMSLDPTGKGRKRWITRWKTALNAFAITFEGRLTPTTR